MSDDLNFDSLAETWKSQSVKKTIDIAKLKRRLFLYRLGLLVLTLGELLLLILLVWGIFFTIKENMSVRITLWLCFALIAGALLTPFILKSRFKSYLSYEL